MLKQRIMFVLIRSYKSISIIKESVRTCVCRVTQNCKRPFAVELQRDDEISQKYQSNLSADLRQ